MPRQIIVDELFAGYVAKSVQKGGEVQVASAGFTSTEDGDNFVRLLEGAPSIILDKLGDSTGVRPSVVDHLLAIIHRDKTTTVYVNELKFLALARAKRRIEAGCDVYQDDLADITRLSFPGVAIPDDAGYIFLFSCGWRKGLVFDFTALHPDKFPARTYDVEEWFGHCLAYLQFQHMFKIRASEWDTLFMQKWFPFITLPNGTIREIIHHAEEGWQIDDLLDRIEGDVRSGSERMRHRWQDRAVFSTHLAILETALERFLEGDYISSTSILYPRIEGIMRTHHRITSPSVKESQSTLVNSMTAGLAGSPSMLLPDRFEKYLRDVYFASFDPANPSVLSRHSVAHGVAPASLFDRKAAILAFLILDQLSFYTSDSTLSTP